jgi:hypothetical protein
MLYKTTKLVYASKHTNLLTISSSFLHSTFGDNCLISLVTSAVKRSLFFGDEVDDDSSGTDETKM